MLTVIGVSGKAGSGKNALVDYMKEVVTKTYTDKVFEVSFAKAVKDFGKQYFTDICDPVKKDDVSRKVLQGIGQMLRQEVTDTFWIDKAFEGINKLNKTYPDENIVVFITDVRYQNEADELAKQYDYYNGVETYLIRLDGRTSLTGEAAKHLSETDLDDYLGVFDTVYDNVNSLEELYDFGYDFIHKTLHKGAN